MRSLAASVTMLGMDGLPVDWAARARAWIDADPDPETQRELALLVEAEDLPALAERLGSELDFGTAGLRGIVGAGSARMNRAVVVRATRALAEHLLARHPDARTLPVVLGYDARLDSRSLAEAAAGVLVGAGLCVRYFERPVPTPLVAYVAKQLGAVAAIVITASHNPPAYNGYKVYGADAVQLNTPADADIARRREGLGAARSIPCEAAVFAGQYPGAEPVSDALFERYLAEVDAWRSMAGAGGSWPIVYTPLHGVGGDFVMRALRRAGYSAVTIVPEQAEPDGRFPTVVFPNPEEAETLERAFLLATKLGAELVLANDPDADRLSVAIPTPAGRWQQLGGNQVGLLLADTLLEGAAATPQPLVVASVVSSPMLERIAAAHGARCERTLTGFKWICGAGLALEREGGVRFVFGFEEAMGYAIPVVRDKDGISAALLMTDLAARCRREGRSLQDHLERLYRRHGLWVSCPRSIVRGGPTGAMEIAAAMERLRRSPPTALMNHSVEAMVDMAVGAEARPPWLGATNLVELELGGGSRILVRPSGTEPKLKIYTEVCRDVGPREGIRDLHAEVQAEAEAITQEVARFLDLG